MKMSRNDQIMEEIPLRNSWLEINLQAIEHNVFQYRKLLQKSTMLLAVVKANAYGHGSIAVAQAAIKAGADYLGVATIGEAVEIRNAGIKMPLLILGLIPDKYIEVAIQQDCILTVSDIKTLSDIEHCAEKMKKIAKIHLKVNTGMNRIGFNNLDAWKEALDFIDRCAAIECDGVFTHFADADGETKTYTQKQAERFDAYISCIPTQQRNKLVVHAANSAATINYTQYHYDMVRLGIGMYGYSSVVMPELNMALQWKSNIIYIHEVCSGDGIGYNCTKNAVEAMQVAVVPVGYADGYPRKLSNIGEVIVGGQKCKIVGRVCMDQIMIDITGLNNIKVGDMVILLGRDKEQSIDADDLAKKVGTISYEILTSLSVRLPRYYDEQ